MSKQVESQLVAKAENPKTTGVLQRVRSGEQGEDFQEAGSPFYESRFQANLATIPVRAVPNKTGLPDNLKAGVEALSGFSMDSVRVHYNSSKPAQLQALAYTQGTETHVGTGQEKYLAHEAWHVVQQKQGRVKKTKERSANSVNKAVLLEREAQKCGEKITKATNRTTAQPSIYPQPFNNDINPSIWYAQCNCAAKRMNAKQESVTTSPVQLMQSPISDVDEEGERERQWQDFTQAMTPDTIINSIGHEINSSSIIATYAGIPMTVANNLLSGAANNTLAILTACLALGVTSDYIRNGWLYYQEGHITKTQWVVVFLCTLIYAGLQSGLIYEGSQLEGENEVTDGVSNILSNILIGGIALTMQIIIAKILKEGSQKRMRQLVREGIDQTPMPPVNL